MTSVINAVTPRYNNVNAVTHRYSNTIRTLHTITESVTWYRNIQM